MPYRSPRRLAALVLLAAAALAGCGPAAAPPELPPTGVYDHSPDSESATAVPVPPGTATAVTRPLTGAGWFCAQVRANGDGRAVWCRIGRSDGTGSVEPQVAEFVIDRGDRLVWAWFPATAASDRVGPDTGMPNGTDPAPGTTDMAAALTAAWPGSGERARREIEAFERTRQTVRHDTDGAPRAAWRDQHADYLYSIVDGLVVTARHHAVRRWPYGAESYATTMSAAVGDLRAGGYDCAYPPQTSCNRTQSNGYFDVSLRGDQIVSARFGIGSIVESGHQRHRLGQEFPHGLTFLTERVRGPVTDRLERCRRTGTSFAGIVAGTVLVVDARRGAVHGDDLVAYLDVQVGAPLAGYR
ncbi:MAG TPA: hypothetical protein VGN37_27490 [Actinocatenispora sp.]